MILQERGISYTFDERDVEGKRRHWWKFRYKRQFKQIQVDENDVYILGNEMEAELGFYKLLDHWNRSNDWRYWSKLV